MTMPRGEPTRLISIRIPGPLAESMEKKAKRVGRTLREEIQALCTGTFRQEGARYSWDDATERKKLLRLQAEYVARLETLEIENGALRGLLDRARNYVEEDYTTTTAELLAEIAAMIGPIPWASKTGEG